MRVASTSVTAPLAAWKDGRVAFYPQPALVHTPCTEEWALHHKLMRAANSAPVMVLCENCAHSSCQHQIDKGAVAHNYKRHASSAYYGHNSSCQMAYHCKCGICLLCYVCRSERREHSILRFLPRVIAFASILKKQMALLKNNFCCALLAAPFHASQLLQSWTKLVKQSMDVCDVNFFTVNQITNYISYTSLSSVIACLTNVSAHILNGYCCLVWPYGPDHAKSSF